MQEQLHSTGDDEMSEWSHVTCLHRECLHRLARSTCVIAAATLSYAVICLLRWTTHRLHSSRLLPVEVKTLATLVMNVQKFIVAHDTQTHVSSSSWWWSFIAAPAAASASASAGAAAASPLQLPSVQRDHRHLFILRRQVLRLHFFSTITGKPVQLVLQSSLMSSVDSKSCLVIPLSPRNTDNRQRRRNDAWCGGHNKMTKQCKALKQLTVRA